MVSGKRSQDKPVSQSHNLYALVLAGGAGSRFWPFSRELEPKQFINIIGKESLLQNTVRRLKGLIQPKQIFFITNQAHFFELKKQIEKFCIPDENIILEPQGKNTAPAIGLCARLIEQKNKDAVLAVFPADHYIKDIKKFQGCVNRALRCAGSDFLVTIGIRPNKRAIGYGYIKIKSKVKKSLPAGRQEKSKLNYLEVDKFLEKPSLDKAKEYVRSRDYFWNSGMFVWKVAVFMEELKRYLPELYSQLNSIRTNGDIEKVWHKIRAISVDYGIMERSKRIVLVLADFDWSDLGAWDALEDLLQKDKNGNVLPGNSLDFGSSGLCAFSRGNRLIATIGLKGLIIADTPDALLVCDKQKTQEVKKIVEHLKSSNRKEHIVHLTDKRPWGFFTVLMQGPGFKIKLIEIEPKKRLSLQAHNRRAEHWVVVSGRAKVERGKDIVYVNSNESIYIPRGIKHRLENPANIPLKIVEVQTGSYLEEDDIRRFDDDYNREGEPGFKS